MQLIVINGDLSGCVPCFFRTLRLEGETILCPSYATLQRVSGSYRLVAWTSYVRYRHCRHSLNYHHYCIRHRIESVSWSWLVCQFFLPFILKTCYEAYLFFSLTVGCTCTLWHRGCSVFILCFVDGRLPTCRFRYGCWVSVYYVYREISLHIGVSWSLLKYL